jgi:hypothetical protein
MLVCCCSLAGTSACKTCPNYIREYGYVSPNLPIIPNYTNPYYQPLPVETGCHHCFCKETKVNEQEHLECCMCGHRKLKFPKL